MARPDLLLSSGVLALVLFAYTLSCLVKYSPLYTPLECIELQGKLADPNIDADWVNISGGVEKECTNRNAYPVEVVQRIPGEVFVSQNGSLVLVGVSTVPSTVFEAESRGKGQSRMQINLPMVEAGPLLQKEIIEVITTIHVKSTGSLSYLGFSIPSSENKDEYCGFQVRLKDKKVGPTSCATSESALTIPSVDSQPKLTYVQMDPKKLQAGALKKNLTFGLLLGAFGLIGVATIAFGAVGIRTNRKINRKITRHAEVSDDSSSNEE